MITSRYPQYMEWLAFDLEHVAVGFQLGKASALVAGDFILEVHSPSDVMLHITPSHHLAYQLR